MSVHPQHIGSELRAARERRGLSLRQVANSTRISIAALEALEEGHIRRLPGGIFSRAFVRAYAQEVGLDPEEAVRQFVEEFPVDAVTAGSPLVEDVNDDGEGLEAEFRPWPGLAMAGALVVVVLLGLTWIVMWWRGSVDAAASVEHPAAVVSGPSSGPPPPAGLGPAPATETPPSSGGAPQAAPASVPPVPAGLTLTMTPDALCWVRIMADGRSAFEGLLTRGSTETVRAERSLAITVGDAGACSYTLNGRPGRLLGRAGQVVTARITPETVREYQQ